MAILDDVISSGVNLARRAVSSNPVKMWNGKPLKQLSTEERILRKREMNAEAQRRRRAGLSDEQKAEIRRHDADYARAKRSNFTEDERLEYNAKHRDRWRNMVENESEEHREARRLKQHDWDRARFERETPEQREVRLSRGRDYKRRIRGGSEDEGSFVDEKRRYLSLMNNEALLAMYKQTGDVDAFNEWFARNADVDMVKRAVYSTYRLNPEFAFSRVNNAASDYYMAARNIADNVGFNDSDHLLKLAMKRMKFDNGSLYRNEYGGNGVLGTRNVEMFAPESDTDFFERVSYWDDDPHQKEVESLLNGPVRDSFSHIGSEDILDGLIKSSYEQAPNPNVSWIKKGTAENFSMSKAAESMGMSKALLHNKLKQVRQRLMEKGIISSNY